VKCNRVSRTSKIVEFMKLYITQQFDEIENIRLFDDKLKMIKENNLNEVSKSFEKKLDERVKSVMKNSTTQHHTPVEIPEVNNDEDIDDIFKSRSTWSVVNYDE
jgi:hypothetical protein